MIRKSIRNSAERRPSLRNALARLVSSGKYLTPRKLAQKLARAMPDPLHSSLRRMEEYTRGWLTGGMLFEELGFYYVGPIDGHNLEHLLPVLKNVRAGIMPPAKHARLSGEEIKQLESWIKYGALAINPNYFLALNNLAILHAEAGQLNEAEAWFRQIIRGHPHQASAHYNLGNLLLERSQLVEASACFSQALRLNPHYADAYCNLGNCYKDQGKLAEDWRIRRRHSC